MAQVQSISSYLEGFQKSYDGTTKLQKVSSARSQMTTDLTTISNQLSDAISSFSAAASDAQIADLNKALKLAKDGIDVCKKHVDGDLSQLSTNASDLRTNIIQVILDNYNKGKNLNTSFLEDVWNSTGGALIKELKTENQKQIDSCNQTITRLNKKGEAQLVSIEQGMNGVKFGVIGNMIDNGVLGKSIGYADNYTFDGNAWEQANPVYHLNTLQELGCAVVGAVEGVLKVGEGILDAGATVIGGVVSLIQGNDDHVFKKFVETDLAGNATGWAGAIFAGSKEAYQQSGGRAAGKFVGNVVAHGALWTVPGLGLLSSAAIGGNRAETVIQGGGTVGEGLWRGAAAGALSLTLAKVLPKVTSAVGGKVTSWASAHSGNIIAKGITGVTNVVSRLVKAGGTGFKNWNTLGVKGKIVSAVATPVRVALTGINKSIKTGAKVLSKFGNSKVGQALAGIDRKIDGLVEMGGASLTKDGRQAMKEYQANRKDWIAKGSVKNSAEYDKMVKSNEKIPKAYRPEIGEKAYSIQEADRLTDEYMNTQRAWDANGRPDSGPIHDAAQKAYDKLPSYRKPTTFGDVAYNSTTSDTLQRTYNDRLETWIRNGSQQSGSDFDAVTDAYKDLPNVTRTSTQFGQFAPETGYVDYTLDSYKTVLDNWKAAGSPESGQLKDALKKAYDGIPNGAVLKPEKIGDDIINSADLRALQRSYNSDLTDYVANGSQQYTAEYQKVIDSKNALASNIQPANPGDKLGTNITPPTDAERYRSGVTAGFLGAGAQGN